MKQGFSRTRLSARVPVLLTLVGALFMFGALPLLTQVTAAHAAECAPAADTACVQGSIKTSTGEPAENVELTLAPAAAAAADAPQRASTDANGRWVFSVDTAGSYVVTLDTSTLPSGQFAKVTTERTVEVALFESVSALFPLTDDESAAAPADGGSTPGGSATPAPSATTSPSTTTPPASNTNSDTSASGGATAGAQAAADGSGFSWPRFWQQAASGLRMGLLLALGAVGLSLVFGTTGLSNFAHAEMLSIGGILAFLSMQLTGNIWLSGVLVVVVMAAFGWFQDAVLWKPLRKKRLSLIQMMIVSIGLSIVLQNLLQFFFGANILRIDPSTPATVTIFGVTLTVQSYIAMGIALVAIIAVGLAMKYTRFGRATRAVADNRALAEASGIDVDGVIRVVWTVGVALAGLSGMLLGLVLNGIAWNTGWHYLLLLFAAVILGGIGTTFGAIVGALIIGMIIEVANIWLPGDLKHAAALFILIIVLLVRPQGLFGRKERIG